MHRQHQTPMKHRADHQSQSRLYPFTDHHQANHPTPQTNAVSSTVHRRPHTGHSANHLHVVPFVSVAYSPLRSRSFSTTFPFHQKGKSVPQLQIIPCPPLSLIPNSRLYRKPAPTHLHNSTHPNRRKHESGTPDFTSGHPVLRSPPAIRSKQ